MTRLQSPSLKRRRQPEIADSLPLAAWLRQGEANARSQSIATAVQPQPSHAIAPFLRFYLTADTAALLPLAAVHEVVMVPRHGILPVPDMPPSVLGAYNYRGTLCWLVDLAVQLGYLPFPFAPVSYSLRQPSTAAVAPGRIDSLTAIALASADRALAIVVSRVVDIEVHPADQMQPASAALFPATLLPFVQGYFNPSHSPVLDLRAMLTAADPAVGVLRL